jgi:hypothetical protein
VTKTFSLLAVAATLCVSLASVAVAQPNPPAPPPAPPHAPPAPLPPGPPKAPAPLLAAGLPALAVVGGVNYVVRLVRKRKAQS